MEALTYVMPLRQTVGKFAALIMICAMTGCSDSPKDTTIEEPKVDNPEFTANVSGAVNAQVAGSGIVTYLGP